jgi:hypothetical protein
MSDWAKFAGVVFMLASMHTVAGPGERDEPDESLPAVFGFVRDARGAPVSDAKVTAQVKEGVTFSVTTSGTGAYRFPIFGNVDPANVLIACSKQGYRQTRVTRRPTPAKADAPKRVETECRLERG